MPESNALGSFFHPALWKLLRQQTRGKIHRMLSAFRSRRKLVIAVTAVFLGIIWIGQTVLSVLLREPADPDKLKVWLPVSLFLYCVFHCLKIGSRQPIEPFDWTPAEKQLLLSAPITRAQLVTFRFISYVGAIAAKALCFAIVMIPDLPSFVTGFIGMFLGLTLIDLFRILLEQVAWLTSQSSRRHWFVARALMLVPAGGLLVFAFFKTFYAEGFGQAASSSNPMTMISFFLARVGEISSLPVIATFMIPWHAIIDVALSTGLQTPTLLKLICITAATLLLGAFVYRVDSKGQRWLEDMSRRQFRNPKYAATAKTSAPSNASAGHTKIPTGLGGARAILWYQTLGAKNHTSALMFSLGIPVFLCCIPMLAGHQILNSYLNILGSIVFYSFVLLPAALMLDFRRDARKLILWKSFPTNPMSLTIGQVAVPVALMSLFQAIVLAVAVSLGGYPLTMLWALPLFLPMNVFIIGMENAIFLMHPMRRNQEGIEVFLRTILTFTGKGVLFALGLALAIGWALLSLHIAKYLPFRALTGPLLFGGGVWLALSTAAWCTLKLCARLFTNMDVSQDIPATV